MRRSLTSLGLSVASLTILLLLTGFQKKKLGDPGLKISLWAKQPFLKNPVAISHDAQGRLFVSEANRRKSTDLDVRNMKGLEPIPWPALDYSLESVEERRTLLKQYLDPANGITHAWFKDYNGDGIKNWHDLQVKTERINLLEDTDGDGVADKASVFAEGFNSEVTGTAGGVLWFNDRVYFTVIPDLWILNDTDQDGVADTRDTLISGHGVHIGQGGHDLHGLTIGPDGRIYWSIGDKGINITSKEGQHFFYPNQGVVMRSEPDGSHFEVFAHGLRNCQEISFDDYGNLFCVDNDGDFKGERERLVYVTQHSDTGWRINWQYNHTNQWADSQKLPRYNPWMDEDLSIPHFDQQAAYITPTLQNYSDGPAGFTRNPGTALSPEYENRFFLTQFPGKLITSFELVHSGASFKMVNESTFHEGFMATGLSFAPDGSLFIADWAGNWEPTEEGGIVRVDVSNDKRHPLRDSTQVLIQTDIKSHTPQKLRELLAYPDQRVRLNAQFELVRRKAGEILIDTAHNGANQLSRIHSIWGLGQLLRTQQLDSDIELELLLADSDVQIKIQACRLILEDPIRFKHLEDDVRALLEDTEPHVRFHAAMALTEIGSQKSVESIIKLLADNDNKDPFIRHAGVMALSGSADLDQLVALKSHTSRPVRRATVVTLRRLKAPEVAGFLTDPDPLVALEAARAIHDDYGIPEAMPALAALLNEKPLFENEGLIRRSLNANLRLGDIEHLEQVLLFAADNTQPSKFREEALDIIFTWQKPPVLDRVERRFRELPHRNADPIVSTIQQHLPSLLASNSSGLNRAVFDIVGEYGINLDASLLTGILKDESRPAFERIEALSLLAPQKKYSQKAFKAAFKSSSDSLRIEALSLAMDIDSKRGFNRIELVLKAAQPNDELQHALNLLAGSKAEKSKKLIAPWVDQLISGSLSPEVQLDVYYAGLQHGLIPSDFSESTGAPLAYTLYGGNADKGAQLFQNHPGGQCIRCHAINDDEGSNVGPNLSGIGAKVDNAYLLESLVEPSRTMAEGYPGSISAMPPMGSLFEPLEIRDLIAFLNTL